MCFLKFNLGKSAICHSCLINLLKRLFLSFELGLFIIFAKKLISES